VLVLLELAGVAGGFPHQQHVLLLELLVLSLKVAQSLLPLAFGLAVLLKERLAVLIGQSRDGLVLAPGLRPKPFLRFPDPAFFGIL
jgi:hypothetical protein